MSNRTPDSSIQLLLKSVLVPQPGLTLCNPMDGSPPGSSVHGILQERVPAWEAIPFSRGSDYIAIQQNA